MSSWTAALAYWTHQADARNDIALALVEAAGNIVEQHLPIQVGVTVTSSDPPYPKDVEAAIAALPQGDSLPNAEELLKLDEGLNLISQWLTTAGVGAGAIACWKLNVLADRFPSLGGAAADAQQLLGQSDTDSPTGMIASQVAQMVSEKLGETVSLSRRSLTTHPDRGSVRGMRVKEGGSMPPSLTFSWLMSVDSL